MTVEEIKLEINTRTGIPIDLLKGETVEENIARAKAILAYKREREAQAQAEHKKTTREQFSEYVKECFGKEEKEQPDFEAQALLELERSLQVVPTVRDGGNTLAGKPQPDERSNAEKFAEWADRKLSNTFDDWF